MAFETNNFEVAQKLALPKSEFNVECNVSAGDNIGKILFCAVDAAVQSSEVVNGLISYTGSIDIKLGYLNEEGEVNVANSSCPFSSKFEDDNIMTGQDAKIAISVVDYNIDSFSAGNAKISVMLMQSGFVYGNQNVSSISASSDDICFKTEDISVIKYTGSCQETFKLTSEMSVREKIKKILTTSSKVVIKSVESGVNFVTVCGEIVSRVLFINENDKFESEQAIDSFKEEIEFNGLTRESFVEGYACVKQEEIETEIVEDEKGSKIAVNSPINIVVYGFEHESISIIKDLYSTKFDTSVNTQSFDMLKTNPSETIEGKIEGSLILEEDKPRVDKILFFGGNNATVTNNYISDGEITIEGIARTNVIYLNDEDGLWHSVQLDIPWTISDKTSIEGDALLQTDVTISDVDVSVKKGREILFDARIKANVNFAQNCVNAIISSAQENEAYPNKDYSMEILFAKQGEDVWEIAKASKVKEEQILTQNPDVTFPLNEDSSIVLFYQKIS